MTVEVVRGGTGVRYIDATGGAVSVNEMQPTLQKMAREIALWAGAVQGYGGYPGLPARPNLINRQAYTPPNTPYAVMQTCFEAVDNDDVVGGVGDVTEGLMFQGLKWESESADEADIFNQMARDINLDKLAREWHREEYTYSQTVMGIWWSRKVYTLRSKTATGKASKKKYDIMVPAAITFLDPKKVVPLQPGPFGQDRLAWHALKDEYAMYIANVDGLYNDAVMAEFMNGPANITDPLERGYLTSIGINPDFLIMLNPRNVVRHTRTKSSYERFPSFRLKSTFQLLDMKQQLMEADRVSLVGAANFILLVRQGSKEEPAQQAELDNLQENFKVVAKIPVVIGDHRLQIDIITPSQEHVLESTKYDTIDRRLMSRTFGALTVASSGQRNENSLSIARGIGRLLESRRLMFKRFLEENVARAVVDHPYNAGIFDSEPNLTFTPRNIQLDSDAEITKSILALRTQKELSRESTLEYFGFDQAVEAMRRVIEADPTQGPDGKSMDDTFQTQVPFDSPNRPGAPGAEGQGGEPPAVSGARGGRPTGGGDSPQSVDGQLGK